MKTIHGRRRSINAPQAALVVVPALAAVLALAGSSKGRRAHLLRVGFRNLRSVYGKQWVHHAPDQRQPSDAARETHVAGGGQVVSRAASVSADKWRSAGPTSSGLTWRHYFPFQIQELVISEAIRHHKRFPTIKHGSQGHIEFRYPGYRNRTPRCYQVGGHEYLKGLGLHITHHLFKPSGRIPHY